MSWKEHLSKAVGAVKDFAESETARNFAAKTMATAEHLAQKAKEGALDAAQAFVEANSDPAAVKLRYLNADISVGSPSDGLEIRHLRPGTLVVSDGQDNGVDAGAACAYAVKTVRMVSRLNKNTYNLGHEEDKDLTEGRYRGITLLRCHSSWAMGLSVKR